MIPEINIGTREQWRDWLRKNHRKESKVKVIIHRKHTGKPSPSHREMMEEAICFGWIDTTLKRRDEDTYIRNFSKRTKNSRWSNNTLSYAQDMIKKRKMSKQGLKYYEEGLKKPVIDHGVPKNPDTPELMKKALEKKDLYDKFMNLAPSTRRLYVIRFVRAVRPETKQKRINEIISILKK